MYIVSISIYVVWLILFFYVSNFCPFLPRLCRHPLLRLSDPWRRWPNCYPGVPRLVPWCPNYGLNLVDLWVIDLVDLLLTQPQKQLQAVAQHSPKAVMSCWIRSRFDNIKSSRFDILGESRWVKYFVIGGSFWAQFECPHVAISAAKGSHT